MNNADVVSALSWVRRPCRQFQRRHVTPASSLQTTSPGSGCSTTGCAVGHGVERLGAGGADESGRAHVRGQVLTAEGDLVEDGTAL